MKKMITTMLLVASMAMGAQTMTLTAVTPNRACPGDTLSVSFKFNGTPGVYQFNMACSSLNKIWSRNSNLFYGLPKVVVNGDTVYTIKLATDGFWPNVVSMVTLDWVSGFSVDFNCGTTTGLSPEVELVPRTLQGQETVYYDMLGNVIKPRFNEVLIERKGSVVKKVYFQN
jgi:hypothetical protein